MLIAQIYYRNSVFATEKCQHANWPAAQTLTFLYLIVRLPLQQPCKWREYASCLLLGAGCELNWWTAAVPQCTSSAALQRQSLARQSDHSTDAALLQVTRTDELRHSLHINQQRHRYTSVCRPITTCLKKTRTPDIYRHNFTNFHQFHQSPISPVL